MKLFRYTFLSFILAVAAIQGCDTSVVNEPVDIEAPAIRIQTPTPSDSLSTGLVDITFTVTDNDRVQKVEVYLDGSVLETLSAEPWKSSFDTTPLGEGTHEIKLLAYDAAGNVGQARLTLRKGDSQVEEVPRMTLVEIVTSANCPPCGPQNEAYHKGIGTPQYEERVATIKYHVWWPRPTDALWHHSSEWSRPRVEYLFDPIPPAQFGAPKGWVGGQMISNLAVDWLSSAAVDMELPAGAKIELESTREGNSVALTIRVTGLRSGDYDDLRLHTAVTENDIEYNDGNSENIHYEVLRRMYPDAQGEAVSIGNGQTAVFERNITIDAEWNAEKLVAVVFLQSKGSKEVLQAAKKAL
ncbi:MAG: Omp28-related outer membrane protein [Bacteroidota bacterium]|nr:Omp28-related outer membrane protein [Bacteroidota bacterium]